MRRAVAALALLLQAALTAFAADGPESIILFYGQSNAGGSGTANPVLVAPVFPDRVSTFATTSQSWGGSPLDPSHLAGTGPLRDDPRFPPYPATAMAYALAKSGDERFFLFTVWFGGQPLGAFLNGTTAWDDLMIAAARSQAARPRHLDALVFIQGEAGPSDRAVYGGMLGPFLDEVLPALARQTGQAAPPVAIIVQTNSSNASPAEARGVPLAQWDIARSRPRDVVLAGPTYQFPLADRVHQSVVGRMMLGDMLALAYRARIMGGAAFEPLHPVSIRLEGSSIRIAFARPAGALPLAWDRTHVPAVPDEGFAYEDDRGSAAIRGVEITGPSEVTLHLDRAPAGGHRIVRYAMGQPLLPGWAPGRGSLMAPTMQRSAFAGLAAAIPETVSHYAIRFEMPVE